MNGSITSINEKLIGKRCIVVSVGLYPGNAKSALTSTGLNDGDIVVLVNSEPREVSREVLRGRRRQPTEAMEVIRRFVNEAFSDLRVDVREVWLDPRLGVVDNVVLLRSVVESLAPCRVVIAMAGGLRWLSVALMFLALSLSTVGRFSGVHVERVFTMLEEESPSIRALFRGAERIIEWPFVPRLTDVGDVEYEVLRLIASGLSRAKQMYERINEVRKPSERMSMATLQRVLVRLRRKGLVRHEQVGKAFKYELTELGKLLVGQPQKQP